MSIREFPVIRLRSLYHHLTRRAAAFLGLSAALALGQTDPLVSKTVSRVIADEAGFWAFAGDGIHFSRINPFKNVLDVRNGSLPIKAGIRGGAGRVSTALVFFNYALPDTASASVGGLAAVDREGKSKVDSLIFFRPPGQSKQVTLNVELSAMALWHDTVILGAGTGGFALAKAKGEGQGTVDGDSLFFRALPEGEDSSVASLRCPLNKNCIVTPVSEIAEKIGLPDSVSALAVSSASSDSVWLLIGTRTGLRRGLLAGQSFPVVNLPQDKPGSPIRIESIHADGRRGILWVFSGSEYFFSGDHGATFHPARRRAGTVSDPDSLTGFSPSPEAINIGDTTFVNFNLDNPGLVLFNRDTVAANKGTGDFADLIFDQADGLPIETGQGRLTTLAVASSGGETALAVGTTSRGLFLRRTGGGNTGEWTNVNSLKALKGGLQEVITFPTLFSGTAPDGSPEYVNLGYRLKKGGNVTISVYNYAMEKVKTVVKGAPRKGGGNRSENPAEDRWDGKDQSGRHVSVGVYYIRVETDKGEHGWGKAIAVHGRGP